MAEERRQGGRTGRKRSAATWLAPVIACLLGAALVAASKPAWRGAVAFRLQAGARAMGLDVRHWPLLHHGLLAFAIPAPAGGAAVPAAAPSERAAATLPVPPTILSLNLASPVWWNQERSFANLAIGGTWQRQVPSGWERAPASSVSADGTVIALPANAPLMRTLAEPDTGPGGMTIRCGFTGKATLAGGGVVTDLDNRSNGTSFHLVNNWQPPRAWVTATAMPPGGRIGALDCRETGMAKGALYAPAFLQSLRGFGVIRFKDWQIIDTNEPHRWADRHQPGGIDYVADDGVAIEDMLALCEATGADPWFTMPWNADEAYYRSFARLVHDRLPAGRKVYVELANEVWNWGYPVTHQASREGVAAGLTKDGNDAIALRLAEKTIATMKPWEQVFADRPGALVRVVATQHGNLFETGKVFGFPGLAAHVDALATAPYFGLDVKPQPGDASLDAFFGALDAAATKTLGEAVAMKAFAHAHGKRYIAYEAGQHVMVGDVALQRRIQRDPRMEAIYRHYLGGWAARVGDVIALFDSSSPIDGSGAWGLVEHGGQLLSETPKLRAVRAEMDALAR